MFAYSMTVIAVFFGVLVLASLDGMPVWLKVVVALLAVVWWVRRSAREIRRLRGHIRR